VSGKIKSTIELAMEKAARLPRLTKEERRRQHEREYAPRGRALAERFLTGDLDPEDLDLEGSAEEAEQQEIVREAFLASLCQAIDLEAAAATARAFEGIRALAPDGEVEEASSRVSDLLRDYQEEQERELARAEEAEAGSLRELGVSGTAIRLNMERSERWRERRSELEGRYRPRLDEIKRGLGDRLRRLGSPR
jgi:hypothetical protein